MCSSDLASFSTHDLPTFAGWLTGHDRRIKEALGINPGDSEDERRWAVGQLRGALEAQGFGGLDFPAVAKFLAATPSRLVVIAMEDALAIADQPNVPGTVNEHPNWRRRLPVALEDLFDDPRLHNLGRIMREAGRKLP